MSQQKSTLGQTGETARKDAVNPPLGHFLRSRGIAARAERRNRGDPSDIRFNHC